MKRRLHKTAPAWAVLGLSVLTTTAYPAALTQTSQVALSAETADKPIPNWTSGALLLVEGQGSALASIDVFNSKGVRQMSVPLALPAGASNWISGFSHGADGSVAACGTAIDSSGRRASYVFLRSPSSNPPMFIQTGSYSCYRVVILSDGTLWTAGMEALDRRPFGSSDRASVIQPFLASPVLRHFNRQGGMIGSAILQSSISDFVNLTDTANYLVTDGSRVVWYSSREGRYVQISPDGTISDSKVPYPPGEPSASGGFALTQSAGTLISVGDSPKGYTLYNLVGGQWKAVTSRPKYIGLLGAEGDSLVTMGDSANTITFSRITN